LYANRIQFGAVGTVTVFLKHFDAAKKTLFGNGAPRTNKVGDIVLKDEVDTRDTTEALRDNEPGAFSPIQCAKLSSFHRKLNLV